MISFFLKMKNDGKAFPWPAQVWISNEENIIDMKVIGPSMKGRHLDAIDFLTLELQEGSEDTLRFTIKKKKGNVISFFFDTKNKVITNKKYECYTPMALVLCEITKAIERVPEEQDRALKEAMGDLKKNIDSRDAVLKMLGLKFRLIMSNTCSNFFKWDNKMELYMQNQLIKSVSFSFDPVSPCPDNGEELSKEIAKKFLEVIIEDRGNYFQLSFIPFEGDREDIKLCPFSGDEHSKLVSDEAISLIKIYSLEVMSHVLRQDFDDVLGQCR